jgi:hypothetical protein
MIAHANIPVIPIENKEVRGISWKLIATVLLFLSSIMSTGMIAYFRITHNIEKVDTKIDLAEAERLRVVVKVQALENIVLKNVAEVQKQDIRLLTLRVQLMSKGIIQPIDDK